MSVLLLKQRISVFVPPFGGVVVTYAIHLYLVSKLTVDFLWAIIEHFTLALTAEALIRLYRPLLKEVGHFGAKY